MLDKLKVRITDITPDPYLTARIADDGELSEIVINAEEDTAEVILSVNKGDVAVKNPLPGKWEVCLTDDGLKRHLEQEDE